MESKVAEQIMAPCEFTCGACTNNFSSITYLHNHLASHIEGGSYHYDHNIKTAFPKYDSTCALVQTENTMLSLDYNRKNNVRLKIDSLFVCKETQTEQFDVKSFSFDLALDNGLLFTNSTQNLGIPGNLQDFNVGNAIKSENTGEVELIQDHGIDELANNIDTHEEMKINEEFPKHVSKLFNKCDEGGMVIVKQEVVDVEHHTTLSNCSQNKWYNMPSTTRLSPDMQSNTKSDINDELRTIRNPDEIDAKTTKPKTLKDLKRNASKTHADDFNLHNEAYTSNNEVSHYEGSDYNNEEDSNLSDDTDDYVLSEHDFKKRNSSVLKKTKRMPTTNKTKPKNNKIKLKCEMCNVDFSNFSSLNNHMNRDHHNMVWKCVPCGKKYKNYSGLWTHQMNMHSHNTILQCDICKMTFSSALNLKHHKIEQHFTEVAKFNCKECKRQFCHKASYKQHMNHKHNQMLTDTFICETCGFVTSMRGRLRDHMKTHEAKEKKYACHVCQFVTTGASNLKKHMQRHSNEKNHVCHFCGKGFKDNGSLVIHIRTHTGDKPYKCNLCSKSFSTTSSILRHRDLHAERKAYKCEYCQKSFTQKINCVAHTRQHTGEQPYKCDVCGEGFTHNVSRKNHMVKHHNV